jgi:glycosyltransferase involved in cell wall biosynthesis
MPPITSSSKPSFSSPPLVSIVTIVRNGEKTLKRTIQSVLDQTYSNIEYLVLDGGSTDGTLDIIKQYEKHFAFWKSGLDGGISAAMNMGIQHCKGELIGLIHADDWYERDTVEAAVRAWQVNPESVICGHCQYWRGNKRNYVFESRPELLTGFMSVNHPTCFMSAALYNEHGLFRTEYRHAMDYELLLRLVIRGVPILSLDRVLANMSLAGHSDRNWISTLWDAHRTRIEHGVGVLWKNWLNLSWQIFRGLTRRLAEQIGAERFVDWFRSHFSALPKHRF